MKYPPFVRVNTNAINLHWMGLEDEAEHMQMALQRVKPGVTSLVGLYDTD
jgi:hypothetical protein